MSQRCDAKWSPHDAVVVVVVDPPTSIELNTSWSPSGDQTGASAPSTFTVARLVSLCSSPEHGVTEPQVSRTTTRCLPSGDHDGEDAFRRTSVRSLPSGFIVETLEPSAPQAVTASVVPSGDQAGSVRFSLFGTTVAVPVCGSTM